MSGGSMLIHLYDNQSELFDIDDFNTITVEDLLNHIIHRFYGDDEERILSCHYCLCEGPYAREVLNDVRLRQIIEMVRQHMVPNSINEESTTVQPTVHLWLFNYTNNGFLFEDFSTTSEPHNSEDTRPAGNNSNSQGRHFQTTYSEFNMPQPLHTEMDSVQNIPSQNIDDAWDQLSKGTGAYLESLKKPYETSNTSNESSNENDLKIMNDFRKNPKKQFRTDSMPIKKNKKIKEKTSTNQKATSQTANKKQKIYVKNKTKHAFHLQAVVFKKGCEGGRYPRIQLPRSYRDLIEKGQVVRVFAAATKVVNGRRYLDALKGFLIDKKNPKIALENPCIVELKLIDRTKPLPPDYPLKLALIQVSGDKNRKSTIEYNENFNFAQRTVDETSKYSDYNSINDTDEPEDFQITVVPVKDYVTLVADWSMVTNSNLMHYKICKSNKKQKTKLNVAGPSSSQEQLKKTQENEEYDGDDDEEEEEEDNGDEQEVDDDDDDDEE